MKRKPKTPTVPTIYDRPNATTEPAIVVFGMTDKGLPQAAWFNGDDAELAAKAAKLMGLRAARVETDQHRELAGQLRQGQVFASDRTFAPVVREELYHQLFELCGSAPAEELVLGRPRGWEDVVAGSIVLANDGDPDEGWHEALVMAANEHLLQLRWRGSAREPSFIRTRAQIALPAAEGA